MSGQDKGGRGEHPGGAIRTASDAPKLEEEKAMAGLEEVQEI